MITLACTHLHLLSCSPIAWSRWHYKVASTLYMYIHLLHASNYKHGTLHEYRQISQRHTQEATQQCKTSVCYRPHCHFLYIWSPHDIPWQLLLGCKQARQAWSRASKVVECWWWNNGSRPCSANKLKSHQVNYRLHMILSRQDLEKQQCNN